MAREVSSHSKHYFNLGIMDQEDTKLSLKYANLLHRCTKVTGNGGLEFTVPSRQYHQPAENVNKMLESSILSPYSVIIYSFGITWGESKGGRNRRFETSHVAYFDLSAASSRIYPIKENHHETTHNSVNRMLRRQCYVGKQVQRAEVW